MSNTEPQLKKKSSLSPTQLASYLASKVTSKVSSKPSPSPLPTPIAASTTDLGQGLYDDSKKKGDIEKLKAEVGGKNLKATAHAGAELNRLNIREGDEVEAAIQAKAEAGVKAVAKGEFGDKAGLHGEGKAKAEAKAAAELAARGQAGLLKDKKGRTEAAYAKGELIARAEANAKAKVEGKVAYSDQVSAGGSAEVRAEVVADAHAQGAAAVTVRGEGVGVAVSGAVGASLSATVAAKVEGEVALGDIGLAGDIEVDATALLAAGADGTFVVGANGINLQYNLGAAAGVEFTGTASGSASLNGRTFVKAEGEAGVTLGYVVGAKGRFQIKGGKIVLNMGLAAPAIIPAGVTVDVTPEMNLNPLANLIVGGVADIQWALDGDAQKVVAAPDKAKAKLIADLQAYSDKKIKNLKKDAGTEHYANLDSVQRFVKDRFPTSLLSRKDCDSSACDLAIQEAIIATIKPAKGKQLEVTVVGGKVKAIKNQLEPAAIRGKNAAEGSATVEVGG